MSDILVIGSCMIDLVCYTSRLPKIGETIYGHTFQIGHGGKGANQCIAAKKLQAKTSLVAKLGDDEFGRQYLASLDAHGVSTTHVKLVNGYSSGIAQITVSDKGENQIVIVPGANTTLSATDIDDALELIKKAKVVAFQFENPIDAVRYGLQLVKKHKGFTVLNAAPALKEVDSEILQFVDLLCVNEPEAEVLADMPVISVEDSFIAASKLLELGCQTVILTLGAKGAVLASKSNPSPVHVETITVENVVDTTGAGDAFIGALVYFLAYQPSLSMEDMVSRSCRVASYSITKPGTQASFPTRNDLPSELFS
nr:PREDICTED: ribokinase [Bemisia tabaci]